jgi:hypothetical protein
MLGAKVREKTTDMNNAKSQLELSFEAPALRHGNMNVRSRRLARARWWFQQMHATVDRALDWSETPAARPEQISLTLVRAR